MKIGFICQPWDYITPGQPPTGSIALVTYELARRLSQTDQIVVNAPRGGYQAKHELWKGIQFNRLGLRADALLLTGPGGCATNWTVRARTSIQSCITQSMQRARRLACTGKPVM